MLHGLFLAGAVSRMAGADHAGDMASRIASDVRTRNEAITLDIEKLFMIPDALWTLLKEEHGYSDEDLVRRVQEIDLQDGRLDGKVAKQGKPSCPQCGRKLMGKRPKCLYCGTLVARDPFER